MHSLDLKSHGLCTFWLCTVAAVVFDSQAAMQSQQAVTTHFSSILRINVETMNMLFLKLHRTMYFIERHVIGQNDHLNQSHIIPNI